jgi:hypothetical protein
MWYFSKVFKCLPFLPVLMMSIVSVIVPYVCPIFIVWFEYPELLLLLLMVWMCSLYLILNVLPVWPTYFNGQCRHLIWYMLLLLYLSVCAWCFNMLLIVFCVWQATLNCMFLKSLVICLTSFPQYVKVAHFVLWCFGSLCMFCFCGSFSSRFVLYSFSMVCFIVFFSVCFDFFVIGYVCKWFSSYLIPDNLCSYGWHEVLLNSCVCSVFVLVI